MRHYFEFDGMKSSDYGVFLSGAQTMGAAGRDVDEIVVPGRDGNLTIDNGRFNAISHVYPAFIAETAKANLMDLRNALLSRRGHKRLSDTVHPDEFYRAYYEHGLEPEVTANLRHSEFEIEFTRDPRRFLVAGDTPQDVAVNTETLSGSVVTFDNATGAERITGLSVSVMAAQDGSGDPSPTNIRPITGWTGATVTRTGKNLIGFGDRLAAWGSNHTDVGNDSYLVKSTGTGYSNPYRFADEDIDVTLSGIITDLEGARGWRIDLLDANNVVVGSIRQGTTVVSGKASKIRLNYSASSTGAIFEKIQLELGTQATSYEPYKGTTYPVSFSEAGTVYGGTLDVVNGILTKEYDIVDLGSLSWRRRTGSMFSATLPSSANVLTDISKYIGSCLPIQYAPGYAVVTDGYIGIYKTAASTQTDTIYLNLSTIGITDVTTLSEWLTTNSVQLVYPLATPQTYQLTPTEITTLLGQNNVWADCGDVTVTLQLPSTLINPTRFPSSPKIRVHGQGTLYIGNTAITVGGNFPYVDIDTEIADCSYEGQNANQYVTFSGLDFPKLEPGENYITFTGFTAVEVTPRWWRL